MALEGRTIAKLRWCLVLLLGPTSLNSDALCGGACQFFERTVLREPPLGGVVAWWVLHPDNSNVAQDVVMIRENLGDPGRGETPWAYHAHLIHVDPEPDDLLALPSMTHDGHALGSVDTEPIIELMAC